MQLAGRTVNVDYRKIRDLYRRSPTLSASTEVILTVFAVGFMIFFALRPTLTVVAELRKKIEDQQTVNRRLDSKIVALRGAQQSLTNNASFLPSYGLAVPDGNNLAGLSKRLELLAQQSGVLIDLFKVGAVPILGNSLSLEAKGGGSIPLKAGGVIELEVSFVIEGDFDSTTKFLQALESMDRLVWVKEAVINKEQRKGGQLEKIISTALKTSTYYKYVGP